jgi:hypothetical protein
MFDIFLLIVVLWTAYAAPRAAAPEANLPLRIRIQLAIGFFVVGLYTEPVRLLVRLIAYLQGRKIGLRLNSSLTSSFYAVLKEQ